MIAHPSPPRLILAARQLSALLVAHDQRDIQGRADAFGEYFESQFLTGRDRHAIAVLGVGRDQLAADTDDPGGQRLRLVLGGLVHQFGAVNPPIVRASSSVTLATWLIGTEWCDSVYLALPRPAAATHAER